MLIGRCISCSFALTRQWKVGCVHEFDTCLSIEIILGLTEMHKLVEDYTFNGLWRLVSKFHFLVALGPDYGGTKVLHKKILFQCNCHKYWKRCACAHSLLVGTHLHERSGGFSAEHVPDGGVKEPNCPFGALANKTLGHVARRKMLMHARLKANSSPNIW